MGSGVVAVYSQDMCMPFAGADSSPWSLVLVKAKTTKLDWTAVRSWANRVAREAREVEPLIPTPRLSRYHDQATLEALGRLRALAEEAPAAWRPLLLSILARVAERWSRLRRTPAPRSDATTIVLAKRVGAPIVTGDADLSYVARRLGASILW